jgi:hypothetical protein
MDESAAKATFYFDIIIFLLPDRNARNVSLRGHVDDMERGYVVSWAPGTQGNATITITSADVQPSGERTRLPAPAGSRQPRPRHHQFRLPDSGRTAWQTCFILRVGNHLNSGTTKATDTRRSALPAQPPQC